MTVTVAVKIPLGGVRSIVFIALFVTVVVNAITDLVRIWRDGPVIAGRLVASILRLCQSPEGHRAPLTSPRGIIDATSLTAEEKKFWRARP